MKKKLVLAACAAIVAAAAVCGTKAARSFMTADELFNENVEALASREGHGRAMCFNQYSVNKDLRCLRCYDCIYVEGQGLHRGGICR